MAHRDTRSIEVAIPLDKITLPQHVLELKL